MIDPTALIMQTGEIQEAFYELFYGYGGWLGVLVLLTIVFVLALKVKYSCPLLIVVTVLMGISYLQNVPTSSALMWNAIVMFLSSFFIGLIFADHVR